MQFSDPGAVEASLLEPAVHIAGEHQCTVRQLRYDVEQDAGACVRDDRPVQRKSMAVEAPRPTRRRAAASSSRPISALSAA
jgi:hypothetical protein